MKKKIRLVKLKSKKVALVHRGEGESLRGYALSSAKTEGRTHFSGLRVTFLGTSSAKSTRTRNVSSIVVESDKHIWMFDCGDGTQRQLLYTHFPKSKLECIFITHLHGDHCFGLFSVICNLLFMDSTLQKLDIYGPPGLYDMIFKALSTTSSIDFIWKRVVIHEFVTTQEARKSKNGSSNGANKIIVPAEGSHPIIEHSVNCFGFVVEEKSHAGAFNIELLEKFNVPSSSIRKDLKECLLAGKNPRDLFPFPMGADISQLLGPAIIGRKIVLLGDTSDPSNIIPKGLGCDLLIHETTFEAEDEKKAIQCRHSSTSMAGRVATRMQAKALCITHFSVRYRGKNIRTLVKETAEEFKTGDVIAAKDFLSIDILPHNQKLISHGYKRTSNDVVFIKKKLTKKRRKLKSKLLKRE